jgi:hypothetical protein
VALSWDQKINRFVAFTGNRDLRYPAVPGLIKFPVQDNSEGFSAMMSATSTSTLPESTNDADFPVL